MPEAQPAPTAPLPLPRAAWRAADGTTQALPLTPSLHDLRGFACAHLALPQALVDQLVGGRAAALVAALLQRHGRALEQGAPGVASLLQAWLARTPDAADFDTVWHTAWGDVQALLQAHTPHDVLRSAATVALRLNACGQGGDWEVRLPAPAALRFGPWILPLARSLSVQARDQRVALCLQVEQTWRTLVFERSHAGEWATADAALLEALQPCGHPGMRIRLAPHSALSAPAAQRLLGIQTGALGNGRTPIDTAWRDRCSQALQLLGAASGHYLTWVERVLRDLVPLPAQGAPFHSASEACSPGVVCVSEHLHPWLLADLLVQECSHHYRHIVRCLGPLDDGSETLLHYSPMGRRLHPIGVLLYDYHAAANVLLFYRQARAHGLLPDANTPGDAVVLRERILQAQLRPVEGALRRNRSLTPLGCTLWEPLCEALACQ